MRLAEFIQYLFPPSNFGPSSKTCPKWIPSFSQTTSVLFIPNEISTFSLIDALGRGFVKLGHPVPESNLFFELNNGSPDTTDTYIPSLWLS